MAAVAAVRSISRGAVLRNMAAKVTGEARVGRPPLLGAISQRTASATRFLRCPVEMSCCVESLLPSHSEPLPLG